MSRLILIFVLFLSACSLINPYVDRRREAGNPKDRLYIGKSTPEEPAICYNILTTRYETVQKLAEQECLKHKTGVTAIPVKQTVFTCKVLVPNHYYFKCQ